MIATNCDRLEIYVDGVHLSHRDARRAGLRQPAHPPVFVDLTVVDGAALPELRVDGYVGGQPGRPRC